MNSVVKFTAPKFKPLPSELTPAVINGATLPVRIGVAQRAIAACCDLSELLTWKDELAALAAAAKMAKMPELSRDVNRVHKEAIFRMGELLLQYSGARPIGGDPAGKTRGPQKSARRLAAESAGIDKQIAGDVTRIAKAPSTRASCVVSAARTASALATSSQSTMRSAALRTSAPNCGRRRTSNRTPSRKPL